jgi:hypothetical protein
LRSACVSGEERRLRLIEKATMIRIMQDAACDSDACKPGFDAHEDVLLEADSSGAMGHRGRGTS